MYTGQQVTPSHAQNGALPPCRGSRALLPEACLAGEVTGQHVAGQKPVGVEQQVCVRTPPTPALSERLVSGGFGREGEQERQQRGQGGG